MSRDRMVCGTVRLSGVTGGACMVNPWSVSLFISSARKGLSLSSAACSCWSTFQARLPRGILPAELHVQNDDFLWRPGSGKAHRQP